MAPRVQVATLLNFWWQIKEYWDFVVIYTMYSVDLSPETVHGNMQKETRTINFALGPILTAWPRLLFLQSFAAVWTAHCSNWAVHIFFFPSFPGFTPAFSCQEIFPLHIEVSLWEWFYYECNLMRMDSWTYRRRHEIVCNPIQRDYRSDMVNVRIP
jgi:hypothetical protein